MERRTVRRNGTRIAGAVMASALLACGTVWGAGPGEVEQAIQLHPGWNAVYLEVQPDPADIEAVLAGVPVASVWTLKAGTERIQYVRDPNEKRLRTDGWYGYFPPSRPEHVTTNLFTMRAGQTYLIRLEGESPVTWRVCGRPGMKTVSWVPDSYNLVGFDVDPQAPPTLGEWFKPSAAHDGQPIWEMTADGTWREVTDPYSTTIRPGAAYWVYCQGKSDYQGPLVVSPDNGFDLDFDRHLSRLGMTFRNALDVDVDVQVVRGNGDVPLTLSLWDPQERRRAYPPLPDRHVVEVSAGSQQHLELGVRRADLGGDEAEEILTVTNGLGVRRRVWVHVRSLYAPLALKSAGSRSGGLYSGLWVGTAWVDKVSESQRAGTTPKPAGVRFPLRFILHVDASGQVRLLKEVVRMTRPPTYRPSDVDGYQEIDQPGEEVLVTDEGLFDQFGGMTIRDGEAVPVRLSAIAYDFPGTEMTVRGTVGPTGNLDVTLVLPIGFPTNPFYHRYHPDHDNLDAEFLNFKAESYEITRRIHWRFTDTNPFERDDPDWGHTVLGGIYSEELTGLHRNPIFVEGPFEMQLVSTVAVLNQ